MGKLGGIVIALIIAAVLVGMKYSNKDDAAADTRAQVSALLQTLPDYDEAGPWYEGLADTHHEAVFEDHYQMGGRRTSTSFDAMAYIHDLLDHMIQDAESANQEARADLMRQLKQEVYIESDIG